MADKIKSKSKITKNIENKTDKEKIEVENT